MTSYKLYSSKTDFKIESFFSNDWKNDLQIPKGISENIRRKLEEIHKDIKNSTIKNLKEKLILNFDLRVKFETQDVWIPKTLEIIKNNNLILVQKLSSQIEMAIEKTLGNKIISYTFPNKDLLKLWRKLKAASKENSFSIFLHRIILAKTFLEADEIDELNLCSKDVSKLGYFPSITREAKKVKAITVRLKGIAEKKIFTVRIAQNQIQIYGNHSIKSIKDFLKLLQ